MCFLGECTTKKCQTHPTPLPKCPPQILYTFRRVYVTENFGMLLLKLLPKLVRENKKALTRFLRKVCPPTRDISLP